MVKARVDDFEVCVSFDARRRDGATCSPLATAHMALPSLDTDAATPGGGLKTFAAWIRDTKSSAREEVQYALTEVPYATVDSAAIHEDDDPPSILDSPLLRGLDRASAYVVSVSTVIHELNVAVLRDGAVLTVVELERVAERRYFLLSQVSREEHREAWRRAFEEARRRLPADFGGTFDVGVMTAPGSGGDSAEFAATFFPAKTWVHVNHHASHAALGLWDARLHLGLQRPLVVSYDGGGNDGYTVVFRGDATRKNNADDGDDGSRGALRRLDLPPWLDGNVSLGHGYAVVGSQLPEVERRMCVLEDRARGYCRRRVGPEHVANAMAVPGKLMGYAALGAVDGALAAKIKAAFLTPLENGRDRGLDLFDLLDWRRKDGDQATCAVEGGQTLTRAHQRSMAASAQRAMEDIAVDLVADSLRRAGGAETVDGIVLTGGCALNVLVNSRIAREFPTLPVHVPSAPSDCGLAVGSAWLVTPPRTPTLVVQDDDSDDDAPQRQQHQHHHHHHRVQFTGPDLSDLADLDKVARALGAQAHFDQDLDALAALVADDQIIGLARGPSEHGPRALGKRSLISVPSAGMKERLNALKHREWYRPVAPMVLDEDADRVFVRDSPLRPVHSPYMSFAPRLTAEAAAALPAITHYDGTARPQTVSADDDPWLHAFLQAVKRKTGWGVVINTSFNTRGKPILNKLAEALTLLRDSPELDYVLAEHVLFSKKHVATWKENNNRDSDAA